MKEKHFFRPGPYGTCHIKDSTTHFKRKMSNYEEYIFVRWNYLWTNFSYLKYDNCTITLDTWTVAIKVFGWMYFQEAKALPISLSCTHIYTLNFTS